MLLSTLLLFLISSIALVAAGGYAVRLLIKIASYLRLNEFTVAFIIMAFSTSLPELFVGINSAFAGNPILALGNVIGSNIADLTFVIGIAALLGGGIKIKNDFIKKDSLFMFIIALLPVLLMVFDRDLSRLDGFILVLVFSAYMIYLFTRKSEFHEKFKADKRHSILITLFLFAAVLGILFLSSHFVVFFATQLAIELALPQIFIGLFLIALGTSLPELVFEIKSVLAKKGDLAIGDAMGSVVCNSTLVLGVTALISPIIEASSIFFISSVFMLFVILLFAIMIRSKKGLTIAGSLLLVFAYILFIIFEFYLK